MNDCALIIFTKLPRAGEVKTRLGKSIGMDEAADIYKQFAEHAFTLADAMQSGGVNIYVFFSPGADANQIARWVGRDFQFFEQKGVTLGDRMKHAFDKTFFDGARRAVIIGTDVPELDVSTIHTAFALLNTSDIVLGPSTDGGYYLLGKKPPLRDLFEGVEWSTGKVLIQTLDRLTSLQLSYSLLPEFADVDTEEDYRLYLARTQRA